MQYQFLYPSLAAVAISLSVAQDLSNLPSCAVWLSFHFTSEGLNTNTDMYLQQAPALSSIGSTGCQLTDFACICKNSAFISSLTPVIQRDCSAADIQSMFLDLIAALVSG